MLQLLGFLNKHFAWAVLIRHSYLHLSTSQKTKLSNWIRVHIQSQVLQHKNIVTNTFKMRSKCLLFLSRRRRRKRNTKTESPIAIVSLTPSTSRKRRFINFVAGRIFYSRVFFLIWNLTDLFCDSWHATQDPKHIANLQGNPVRARLARARVGSQDKQVSITHYGPHPLNSRTHDRISGPLTSPGPRYFAFLPPPSRWPCVRVVHSCLLIYIPKYFLEDSIPSHTTMKKTWPKCTHTCTHKTVPRTVRYLSISLSQYFCSVEFVVL